MNAQANLAPPTRCERRLRGWLVARFVFGLVLLLGTVMLVVRLWKPELERLGTSFVERFGLWGVGIGTFVADGFHFPVPPQFYMLLATAAGSTTLAILAAVSAGSLAGGVCGFALARRIGKIPRLERWLERASGGVGRDFGQRYAYRAVIFTSLTPMAFSVLCYLSGLYRLPLKPFALLLLLRLPKLVLYYHLVNIGWHGP